MATTLATEKQAEAIKVRMQQVRCALPYDVDDARESIRSMSDWRYLMRRRPLMWVLGASVVGYWLIPQIGRKPEVIIHREVAERPPTTPTTSKGRGMIAGLASTAASTLIRTAVFIVTEKLSNWISK